MMSSLRRLSKKNPAEYWKSKGLKACHWSAKLRCTGNLQRKITKLRSTAVIPINRYLIVFDNSE
jgi:hypothetical protein